MATRGEPEIARASSAYEEAYDSMTEKLSKVPKDKAVESCTGFLAKK